MTVIAAARVNGNTWIAADTACGDTTGLVREDTTKLWKVNAALFVGLAGNAGQVTHLQYGTPWGPLEPPDRPNLEWLYSAIVAPIRAAMEHHTKSDQDWNFEAVVVARGKIFVIDSDGAMLTAKAFAAVGSGALFAHGYWAAAEPDTAADWWLRDMIKKCAARVETVSAPAVVWNCGH